MKEHKADKWERFFEARPDGVTFRMLSWGSIVFAVGVTLLGAFFFFGSLVAAVWKGLDAWAPVRFLVGGVFLSLGLGALVPRGCAIDRKGDRLRLWHGFGARARTETFSVDEVKGVMVHTSKIGGRLRVGETCGVYLHIGDDFICVRKVGGINKARRFGRALARYLDVEASYDV